MIILKNKAKLTGSGQKYKSDKKTTVPKESGFDIKFINKKMRQLLGLDEDNFKTTGTKAIN